jgi:hypothetical protein
MDVTSIALALNDKKEKWQGSWDILLSTLQLEIFKRAIENNMKRKDKIKENSQLFQNKEEKRQAKKNRAKKGETKKGNSEKAKRKFFCKNHPNSNTHNTKDCRMERQCQGTKRKRENGEQQPNKVAKFTYFNCGGVGHRARNCPTPINKGNSKYTVLTCDTSIMINCTINVHRTRVVVDLGCKCILSSNFHNKTTWGKPRLQEATLQ